MVKPSLFNLFLTQAAILEEDSDTPIFSVRHFSVTGTVARLLLQETPVSAASEQPSRYSRGDRPPQAQATNG